MAEPEQQEEQEAESGIVTHTLETDMKMLGIEEATEPTEKKEEEAETPEMDKPKKSRSQKRIERQQRDFKDVTEKNTHLEDENSHLKEELAELKKAEVPNAKEIVLDDFESYDEYLEAVAEEQKSPKKQPVERKAEPETATPDKAPGLNQTALNDMFEDGNGDYKDFSAKVRNDDLDLPVSVINEVLRTETPSDLIYLIASNPEKATELASITNPHDLTVAITKFAQGLETKETPEVPTKTNAPKPITPVNGSSLKGLSINDDNLSFEQHEALLNSQQTSSRGGFI